MRKIDRMMRDVKNECDKLRPAFFLAFISNELEGSRLECHLSQMGKLQHEISLHENEGVALSYAEDLKEKYPSEYPPTVIIDNI